MARSADLEERALSLAWSLWTELGVPGVERNHADWSVDLEPLMLFTALWSDRDPRLRDEAARWCIANRRVLSRSRLRALFKLETPETRDAFGPFAATIAAHTGGVWAGATRAWRLEGPHNGRRVRLDRPSQLRLRLRSLVGVGARAEILHTFVGAPKARLGAGDLTLSTAFTKANLSEELEALDLAGLLSRTTQGNRALFALRAPERLLSFAAPLPRHFQDWAATLRLVAALVAFDRERPRATALGQPVEAARFLAATADDRQRSGFPERPHDAYGDQLSAWLVAAGDQFVTSLATGSGALV